MEIVEMLTQASIIALVSVFLPLAPLGMGLAYAIRPSEQRLALMRPLSLAAIFAALSGSVTGIANVLRGLGMTEAAGVPKLAMLGLSEALVPLFVGFGCLTVAWLSVAVGLRRQT